MKCDKIIAIQSNPSYKPPGGILLFSHYCTKEPGFFAGDRPDYFNFDNSLNVGFEYRFIGKALKFLYKIYE